MAYLRIGNLNVLPYLESGGIKWGLEDVIGATVTTMDGKDHFDVRTHKRTLSLSFPPLASEYVRDILEIVALKTIPVETDFDPLGGHVLYSMHCDSQGSDCSFIYDDGLVKWSGLEFTLKEF